MSIVKTSIRWSNIDVFTFGKNSIYSYDRVNHCIFIDSLFDLSEIHRDCLHLSSSPSWPIRRILLNENETILALLADSIVYLVDNERNCNRSHLCPIIRVPSNTSINNCLIDFLWIDSNSFLLVNSVPSASECHFYRIRSLKDHGIDSIRTFSVGKSSTNRKLGTPNKKISLHHPSDIIKLDQIKRIDDQNNEIHLIFAMKTDGDLFLLPFNPNQPTSSEFQGPLRILPSTFDNYGADHGESTFLCLSNNKYPLLITTRDQCHFNQSIVLSSSTGYSLYTIDTISLKKNPTSEMRIESMRKDPFVSNRYLIFDSKGNLYSIEINWIEQIQQGVKQFQPTCFQHLFHGDNFTYSLIENNEKQLYLTIIVQSQNNQEDKELILIRFQSNENLSTKNEFLERIRLLLNRNQSIPLYSLRQSSTEISPMDFENNLQQYLQIFSQEYLQKQEKVRKELEKKEKYLDEFAQTQSNEQQQFNERFQRMKTRFQQLNQRYQEQNSRRKRLSAQLNDLLSVIEQNTPVLSDAEIHMREQLEKYQIQFDCLKDSFQRAQTFFSSNFSDEHMDNTQDYLNNYRNQIDQMKQRLQSMKSPT